MNTVIATLEAQGQRGGSWALTNPTVRPKHLWCSRTAWVTSATTALALPQGRELLNRERLSRATVHAVIKALAGFADSRSGRWVTASNATIAAAAAALAHRTSLCPDVVTRTRRILSRLHLAVEEARGRYLTTQERHLAASHHGGHQLRAASTWCLTTPRSSPSISDLPRRGEALPKSLRKKNLPTRAHARVRPAGGPKTAQRRKTRSDRDQRQRPVELWRWVGELLGVCPWLETGKHRGAVCDLVTAKIDYRRWSAKDIGDVLSRDTKRRGWNFPDHIANPLGYLRFRLDQLSDVLSGPTPTEQRDRQRQRLLEAENAGLGRSEASIRYARDSKGATKIIKLASTQSAASDTVRAGAMAHIRRHLGRGKGI